MRLCKSLSLNGTAMVCTLLFVLPIFTVAQTSSVRPRITQAIDETRLTVLRGNTHPLARSDFDRGIAPPSLPMQRMLLVLKRSPQQDTELQTLIEQQVNKASSNYHRWLTPQQFGQEFGPSDQDIQTVTSWLQLHGFQVTRVSNSRTIMELSGTAGDVQEAFHTSIHKYAANREDYWANSSDPQIPEALAPIVYGINTLYNFPRRQMHKVVGRFSRAKTTGITTPVAQLTFPNPCSVTSQPFCNFALAPADFAKIYNVPNLLLSPAPSTRFNGDAVTIAVVAESNINSQDVADFRALFGLPAPKLNVIVNGPDPGIVPGAETEADLDVEWAGAVAPNATIDLVVSESTESSLGADLSALYAVDNNLGAILNESFGECEFFMGTAGNTFYNQLWQQASAQGITVTVSSGDQGSAVCDGGGTSASFGLTVSGFTSTPYNVSVGGTDFNDVNNFSAFWNLTSGDAPTTSSAKGYIPEMTWNNSCTNQEVFKSFKTTTAEQTCNNSAAKQQGLLAVDGGSGGKSSCTVSDGQNQSSCSGGYSKPPWQVALTPNDGKRDVPDISLFASNGFNGSFYIVCESDLALGSSSCDPFASVSEFIGVGGTSASSPAFAGIMALVNQAIGSRQGNANYVLYQLAAPSGASCTSAASPAGSCVFYDVPSGSTIAMPCAKNSLNCAVSNAGDSIGVLSGYATTSGYDLATGLGSVNAANLINKWKTVELSLKSSSTSLTLNSNNVVNITHGQPVSVSATVGAVAPATGTPAGNVSVIANTGPDGQEGLQSFPLTSGSASGTTNALPGGNYTAFAQYAGDGTFSGSSSTPAISVTVAPEASKTFASLVTFDANGNPTSFSASGATYGSGYYLLRADVGDSAATLSSSIGISSNCSKRITNCPTGVVTLTPTAGPLGGGALSLNSGGYAEIQSLATGTYGISATYSGDSSYGSSATSASFTISKAPTTAIAAISGTPVQYGNSEEVIGVARTNSIGVPPTGTFSFFLDGSPLSVSALVYEGHPQCPSCSPPFGAELDAGGLAVFPSLGNHSLTVQYSGDVNYAAATSSPSTFTVTQAQPFFSTFGPTANPINLGQQVTLIAQMVGSTAGLTPTGTMTFYDGGAAIPGTVSYSQLPNHAALGATMSYIPTTPGLHNITVKYSGDTNYLPASTPVSAELTVVGPDFSLATGSITVQSVSVGQTATFTNDIVVSATNGFNSQVNLSCSLPATLTTCSVNPTSLSSASGMATVTVTTTARGLAPQLFLIGRFVRGPQLFLALLITWLLAFNLMGLVCVWHEHETRLFSCVGLALILAVVAIGCGGGSSGAPEPPSHPGTPPGTYTVTVTGTSGPLTHTAMLTLTVN
jgi:hypothetical protein